MKMKKLSAAAKIYSGFGTLMALFIVMVVLAVVTLNSFIVMWEVSTKNEYKQVIDMLETKSTFYRIRMEMLSLMTTTDRAVMDQILANIKERKDSVAALMKIQAQMAREENDEKAVNLLNDFDVAFEDYSVTLEKQISMINAGRRSEAAAMASGIQNERFEKIRSIILANQKIAQDNYDDYLKMSKEEKDKSLLIYFIIGALSIATGFFVLLLMQKVLKESETARQYARSLLEASIDPLVTIDPEGKITDVNKSTVKITGMPSENLIGTDFSDYFTEPYKARDGYQQVFAKGYVNDYPLTLRSASGAMTPVLYNASVYRDKDGKVVGVFAAARDITDQKKIEDEINELNRTLELRIEARTKVLVETNQQLAEAASILASSANQILSTTKEVAAGSTQTATAISETSTTMSEVKQTSHLAAQKAKYVTDTAQSASQISSRGRKAVENTLEGMNIIKEQMESIAETVVQLSEQSQAIGEIAATVNDIAEQVNMLAVNAGIEAAKAGEFGKGFGVVAQEVKSLAVQAKQAAAQVRTILMDVQKTISSTVMGTEQGMRTVENGVKLSNETNEAIRMLATSITETANAATQILATSQEQLTGIDQVASAFDGIKQAMIQNVTGTQQAENAAKNLTVLGQKILEQINQTKA